MSWCTSLLYYVPAKVAGTWKTPQGELTLTQSFQNVTGTLKAGGKTVPVSGKLRGEHITLTAGGTELAGQGGRRSHRRQELVGDANDALESSGVRSHRSPKSEVRRPQSAKSEVQSAHKGGQMWTSDFGLLNFVNLP